MSEWVALIMTSSVDWLWSQRTRILLLATVMQRASPSGEEKASTKKRWMHCSASTLALGVGCVSIRQSLWLGGLFWVPAIAALANIPERDVRAYLTAAGRRGSAPSVAAAQSDPVGPTLRPESGEDVGIGA